MSCQQNRAGKALEKQPGDLGPSASSATNLLCNRPKSLALGFAFCKGRGLSWL